MSNVYTDCQGREWPLSLTLGLARDVKAKAGVDLLGLLSAENGAGLMGLLYTDPERLANVLWSLVQNVEAVKAGTVDAYSFACGLDGTAMEGAAAALLGAIVDFFPRSRVAKEMKTQMERVLRQADDAAIARLREIDRESSNSAGSSPA